VRIRKALLAAVVAAGLGACTKLTNTSSTTTAPGAATTALPSPATSAELPATSPTATTATTVAGPPLAGRPGATTASVVYTPGYQETTVEAMGLELLQTNEPADVSPTSQVHCPGVMASIGSTFVCPVVTPTSTLYEPLKVDSDNPLKLEFAIIDRSNFLCAAHNAWVVQAMANVGIQCSNGSGQGGQGQGQGQG